MSIKVGIVVGGFNFFEVMTIFIVILLLLIILLKLIKDKSYTFSSIDGFIIMFVLWCSLIMPFGMSEVDFKSYLKWILPPLSYILITKAFSSRFQYYVCLRSMVVGGGIAIIFSALAIVVGLGSMNINFWTGLPRYSGLYSGSHSLGHSAGFLVTSLVSFLCLHKFFIKRRLSIIWKLAIVLIFITAGYCLAMSHVRTVIIGLLFFFVYIAYNYSKRILIAGLFASFIIVMVMAPVFYLLFFDVVDVAKGDRGLEEAGSGRPFIWRHNLEIFSKIGLEHQLVGIGIGNVIQDDDKMIYHTNTVSPENVWNSHNDYLETMMQTGIIGLLLQIGIYFSIFIKLLKEKVPFRNIYIGAFLSIVIMNFISNSYISRFGMAQMFYMYFAWVGIPEKNDQERAY